MSERIEALERLQKLREAGVLDEHEFETQKRKVFDDDSHSHSSVDIPTRGSEDNRVILTDEDVGIDNALNGDVDLMAELDQWERFNNFHRPHGALKGKAHYEALRERLYRQEVNVSPETRCYNLQFGLIRERFSWDRDYFSKYVDS